MNSRTSAVAEFVPTKLELQPQQVGRQQTPRTVQAMLQTQQNQMQQMAHLAQGMERTLSQIDKKVAMMA